MSGRKQQQRKAPQKKFKAAGTVAIAGTKAKGKKKPPPPPSNNRKVILIVLGVLVLAAAIVGIVLVIGTQDDYETTQTQFDATLQVQADDEGVIEWERDYSNLNSPKSQKLIQNVKSKLSGALEAEGIIVEEIEVTSLSQAPPVTFTRTEEVRERGRRVKSGRQYEDKTYTDVSFVDVKYKTYAKPEKNAAAFGSTDDKSWDKVGKMVSTRMASAGLQTDVMELKPQASFNDAVERAVDKHAYEITTVKPVPQESIVCDCQISAFGKVSKDNPSIICDCYEGCTGNTKRVIHGGIDDIFSIKTPICPAARYAGVTTDDGGYVEVVFSGFQTVRSGPDRYLNGFEMSQAEYYMKAVTLKTVGSIIKATNPPTTADPSIGGFFRVKTTTLNPFVKHNPGRKLVRKLANPPVVFSIHVQTLDGQPIEYNSLLELRGQSPTDEDQKSQEIQDLIDKIKGRVTTSISGLPLQSLEVEIAGLDMPPEDSTGLIAKVGLVGLVNDSMEAVTTAENSGQLFRAQMERGLTSLGKLVMMRYSADLLAELRAYDEKKKKEKQKQQQQQQGRRKRSVIRKLNGSVIRKRKTSFDSSKRR